ncbi:hypothetical protein O3M35_002931 [Rhynocoris fuscipes]|uniref:Poly [ADP-ribose] polymerase n=1 Tax=Rhynocoris fuscipes TaxID=488301 RepID=A0AAW1CQM7_9HEMI
MADLEINDLPYRAEYAKSGRSVCKSCKVNIDKDSLRLAVMVQSPVYDGKVPNWYHFNCFFGKQRPKGVGDIAHFDSLRWEDQEKIKDKIGETPEAVMKALKSDKQPTKRALNNAVKSLMKDFVVEYAKSSRAMCRGCETKIAKGEVRISKKDFESENARMYGGQDRWHHVECFTKLRDELGFFENGDILPGFYTLKAEDQEVVKKALPKIESGTNDATDGPTSVKKVKKEEDSASDGINEKELKKQNEKMFTFRDALKPLTKYQLSRLLTYNKQEDPPGPEAKLDALADVMSFGALLPCSHCKNGKFIYSTGYGYQCLGNLTEWTKCPNIEKEPKRTKFKVPEDIAAECPKLTEFKYKVGKRLIREAPKSTPTTSSEAPSTSAKVDRFVPFRGMTFFIIGKTQKKKPDIKKKIESWGGTLAAKLSSEVAVVISNQAEVDKYGDKMELAEKLDIPVVSEKYLEECSSGNAIDKITSCAISTWGLNPKDRIEKIVNKSVAQAKSMKSKSRFEKSGSSKIKLKIKGGIAVDPDSGLEEEAHVYVKNDDIYSVVLGFTDVKTNKNSFYKMQILVSDVGKRIWLFRSWGRIGTKIGGHKNDSMKDINHAIRMFKELYFERTGNDFDNRDNFVKQPDHMYPIDIDYGQNENLKLSSESKVLSKLEKPVQDLVTMLFDVDIMQKVLMEFELDLDKMPLGKLSKKQIQKALSVLSELQQNDGDIKPMVVVDATNRFYTLIPHDFGVRSPPLLDNKEIIQSKLEMLESLLEMEVAYSLLKETKSEENESVNPIDAHYAKLNTDIIVLDRNSEEFKLISDYVKNTHAETHSSYTLEIIDVFRAKRNGEEKRFKPFKKLHNRKLLWHGSRITNFAGILSQGLRIAPKEAPVTGYMFGKGIYFADMVSKSANYCMTSPMNPYGLLLLCEVALGDMYERTHADYIEKLPSGKHSTLGVGKTTPDPNNKVVTPEGVEIPLGKGVPSKVTNTSLLYNEYIVYDVAQVKVQYLLKMKFNYNR